MQYCRLACHPLRCIMDLTLILSLTGLALLDSTSIGTLFIPVWLLLAPGHLRSRSILLYLGTITLFYLLTGALLILGAAPLLNLLEQAMQSPVAAWTQLGLGLGLFLLSFRFDSERSRRLGKPDRAERWRQRAGDNAGSTRFLVLLALAAALAEVATMLPYLAAIAILSTSDLSFPVTVAWLSAYCLVMIVPATTLLALRQWHASWLEPLLRKLDIWANRHGETAVGWIIGIAGFLLAVDAVGKLGLPFLAM